ncbi:hypothetical protein ACH5RR_032349 [Cinchona calisaya]|uniref:Uncharacterized protein n=1 Tax=Cinchona calisaya TaxID=153742 RepID=A0ABD2YHU7_9GENT
MVVLPSGWTLANVGCGQLTGTNEVGKHWQTAVARTDQCTHAHEMGIACGTILGIAGSPSEALWVARLVGKSVGRGTYATELPTCWTLQETARQRARRANTHAREWQLVEVGLRVAE